ncbi:MAG: hypothetical protein WBE35_10465 [Candidatus Cybelea sp.]
MRHLAKGLSGIRRTGGCEDQACHLRVRSYLSNHGTSPGMTDEQNAPVLMSMARLVAATSSLSDVNGF